MEQQIRFCRAHDGVRLGYATHGRGPALVKVAHWFTHVEFDWHSPMWRHWWTALGQDHRVVRYDQRGCGLSDREPQHLDLDAFVDDLESVVDAAGVDQFSLLGISQGGPVAIAYAVRHPERVDRLVLCGAYARGAGRRSLSSRAAEEAELLQTITRVGWDAAASVFRNVFADFLVPGATRQQQRWLEELMQTAATPRAAARLRAVWNDVDITEQLARSGQARRRR